MIVRALDALGDWTYGKGQNDYKSRTKAIAQTIQTRLNSFLGDCFFATNAGIDWFNFLGAKNQLALNLAINATILNTEGVVAIQQLSVNLDRERNLTIKYIVQTVTGIVTSTLKNNNTNFILTESGYILATESGSGLTT